MLFKTTHPTAVQKAQAKANVHEYVCNWPARLHTPEVSTLTYKPVVGIDDRSTLHVSR
jgi:hypothetical protein